MTAGILGAILPVDSFNVITLIAVFALVALGLHFTFGLLNVLNLAHGEFLLIGAYTAFQIQETTGSVVFGMVLAFPVAALFGVVVERTVLRFLYARPLDSLLATFGISVMIRQAIQLRYSASPKTVSDPIGGSFTIAGFNIPWWRFVIVIATVILITGAAALLKRTRFGLFARATVRNPALAGTMGINVAAMRTAIFALGCGLAGLAGALIAPINTLNPSFGVLFLVNSFLVVILGGQGSLRGLIGAAALLGGSLAVLQFLISTVFAQIIVLVIAIVAVRVRPIVTARITDRKRRLSREPAAA